MRFFQVGIIIVASFLLVCEALPTSSVSNHAKVSPGGLHQRLLRGSSIRYDDDSEERAGGIDKFSAHHQKKLKDFAASVGFDLVTGAGYSKVSQANMEKYTKLYNKIYAKYHTKKG
ncbi:RxLR effector protein [Phytophthora megakarya]|uniref:RxLR effector protein n=1 Tax=Phytophthora megakarya TaxID=4795 RepID=A0A225WVE1_9STRA|nr:RxLR effector protein [Phytophthora megakarya]